jgi:hypothetical protein
VAKMMAKSVNRDQQAQLELALSLFTAPFLVSLVGARSLQAGLISLGEASEEIFRGDRLPVLHLQQQSEIEIKE